MSWFGNALVWMGFRAKYGLILEDRLDTDIATLVIPVTSVPLEIPDVFGNSVRQSKLGQIMDQVNKDVLHIV